MVVPGRVVRPPGGLARAVEEKELLRRNLLVLISPFLRRRVEEEVGVGLIELPLLSLAAVARALSSSVRTRHISHARTCCTSNPLSNRDSMTLTSRRRGKGSLPPEAGMAVVVDCLRGLLGRGCSSEKELRDVGAKKMLSLSLFCLSRAVVVLLLLLLVLLVMLRTCEVLRFVPPPLPPRLGSRKRVSFSCTAPPPVARPHRRNVSNGSSACKA